MLAWIPTFYTRANVSQDFEHPNVEHHNGTSGLISEEATGPGFFKPHHLFLEVRTHLPLIRDSQEAYLVQTLIPNMMLFVHRMLLIRARHHIMMVNQVR